MMVMGPGMLVQSTPCTLVLRIVTIDAVNSLAMQIHLPLQLQIDML